MWLVLGICIGLALAKTIDIIYRLLYMDRVTCPHCRVEFWYQLRGKLQHYVTDDDE